jgi:hypothetical protein
MKYAVGMGSVAMIYVPSSVKSGSGIEKFIRGIKKHPDRKEIP